MTKAKLIFTEAYEETISKIEDFLFTSSSQDLAVLEWFWTAHDEALKFIGENPQTPAVHPATGDQSWPFADGRYRLFYKYVTKSKTVYLTHIIDNLQANLKIYPGNKLPTYEES